MAIDAGARIGPYEVVSLIGSGGMGEVYLARDTKLGRDVALKVLPDLFTSDAERLARFRREAQVLAALHHPSIAVIHGLEEVDGTRALVLEYIEGETLADRVAAGRIPFDEALGIARPIAEALQAAHDQGVIHRDLKPSNIKLAPDGSVKVLDFGLAKLTRPPEAAAGGTSSLSLSPTITSPAATALGMILGTAAYMAPEQAKGKPADKRADVWAFGCVLFEMLTGQRAFEGEDISETLASVIKGEPEWAALPDDVPVAVRTLLRSCLTKDPRTRLADIAGAIFVLRHSDALGAAAVTPAVRPPGRGTWKGVAAAAILMATVATVSVWIGRTLRPAVPTVVTRFGITLPEGDAFNQQGRHLVALSPDGSRLVYTASDRLNLRRMDSLDAVPIRGTEGTGPLAPRGPFFSPDGEWIGYWINNQLKKISINGGAAVVLAAIDSTQPTGAHWATDNTIVFAQASGIWRVSGDGGTPEQLVTAEKNRRFQHPQLLPGGRALLYTALPPERGAWDQADIIVKPLDGGPEHRVAAGTDARYLPTGHLVFVVRGALMALPFDAATGKALGGPVGLLDGVSETVNQTGAAHFDVSTSGALAYVTSVGRVGIQRTPMWVDRQGQETPLGAEPRPYLYLRLAPDQSRVAFDIPGENRDIWVWDMVQRVLRRLTTDVGADRVPIFTRDSRRIIFSSDRGAGPNLFWQSADGVGEPERLTDASRDSHFAMSTAPDGTILLRLAGTTNQAQADIYALSLTDRKLKPLVASEFPEQNPEISHDGRWMAYQTTKTGRPEIVVRPYPDVNRTEWPVSTAGGTEPLWSHDDRELFFRSPSGAIMRVAVQPGDTFKASAPEQVLPGTGLRLGQVVGNPMRTYDVSSDGRRFLVLKNSATPEPANSGPDIIVVQHWTEELKRRVPVR